MSLTLMACRVSWCRAGEASRERDLNFMGGAPGLGAGRLMNSSAKAIII